MCIRIKKVYVYIYIYINCSYKYICIYTNMIKHHDNLFFIIVRL